MLFLFNLGFSVLFFSISILLTPKLTCKARFAYTVIAVDAIFANTIVTWVTGTIINIYLTVGACGKKVYYVKILTFFICKILFHVKNVMSNSIFRDEGAFMLFSSYLKFHVGTGRCIC